MRSSSVSSQRSASVGSKRSAQSQASQSLGVPKYKPLGSAERAEEDRLLHERQQYELQQKALRRLRETCSFHPEVNRTSSTSAVMSGNTTNSGHNQERNCSPPRDESNHSQSSPDQLTGDVEGGACASASLPIEERLLRKAKMSEMIKREKRELKRVQEEMEQRKFFKPNVSAINPNGSRYRQDLMHPTDLPVEERLLHYGRTVEESRKQMREDREAFEQKQLLEFFRPSTAAQANNDRKRDQQSFLTKAETRKNDRDKLIGEARARQAKEYTFQPSISRLSEQLAEEKRRQNRGSLEDHAAALHEEAEKRRQEKEMRKAEQEALETDRQATKPTTNPDSEALIRNGNHSKYFEDCDFVARQEEYAKVHNDHIKRLAKTLEEEQRQQLVQSEASALGLKRVRREAIEQQVERLYFETPEVSREVKQRLAEQLVREECPFRPQTSLGTEATVLKQKTWIKDVVKRLTIVRAASAPSRDPEHTSSMNDSTHSNGSIRRRVQPSDADEFYRRQLDAVERTQQQLHLKHSEKQLEQQLECTFRPRTNSRPPTPQHSLAGTNTSGDKGPSVEKVQGFSDFLRRKEQAKKLEEEKKRREEALGKGLPCNGPNYTVVMPFKLSDHKPTLRMLSTNSPATALGAKAVAAKSSVLPTRWNVEEAVRVVRGRKSSPGAVHNRVHQGSFLHDDRIPMANHFDPYNSERLLSAIQKYNA